MESAVCWPALLARAGVDVVVLAGGRTVRQITERGLRLESKRFGDFQVRLRSTPQREEPVRPCMITVKATQLGDSLGRVPQHVRQTARMVPFLNGIDHLELVAMHTPSPTLSLRPFEWSLIGSSRA